MPGILFFPVPQEQPGAVVDLFSTTVDATSIPASLDPMPYMYMLAAGVGITAVSLFMLKLSDKAIITCAVLSLLLPMIIFSPLSSNYGQLFWNKWSTSPQVVSKSDTVTKDEPSLIASTHDDFAAAIKDSDSPFVDGLDSACDALKEDTDNPDNLSVLCGGYNDSGVETETSYLKPYIETVNNSDPNNVEVRGKIFVFDPRDK